MIFGRRIEITGTLTLDTHMHIGVSDTKLSSTGTDGETHEVSLVARGIDGPIIPASSLKGVLRAALPKDDTNALFGDGSDHRKEEGHAARLWLDHARLSEETPRGCVFEAKHVALDPATGAAEEHKLFIREMVAAGATFTFHADWFPADGNDITTLAPVFAALRDGVQLGQGATKGHGQIRLDTNTLKLTEYLPDDEGKLAKRPMATADLYEAINKTGETIRTARRIILKLQAEGPFLSVRETGGHNRQNEMLPLEKDGKPMLWPEGLAGALRARARWLAALDADDGDHNDAPSKRRSREDLTNNLSEIEHLFGVTGRGGKLSVRSVTCDEAVNRVHLNNNSIDRFTGGTRDKALYGKYAFWQPRFTAELDVDGEHPLLTRLLDDLKTKGLELGHGATTGFGWFKVEVADDRA